MSKNLRTFVVFSVVVLGLVVPLSMAASGTRPTKFSFASGADLGESGLCSFGVSITASFGGFEIDFFDKSGNLVRSEIHVVEQDTFTSAGGSVTGEEYTFNLFISFQDGEVVVLLAHGVAEKIRLPNGELFLSAGVIDFIAQGVPFSFRVNHGVTGDIDALCAALSS